MSSKFRQKGSSASKPGFNDANDAGPKPGPGREDATRKRRQATVYDAVAGRVSSTLPMASREPRKLRKSHHKRAAPDSRRNPILAPQEVLFKRAAAPERFAEKDIYLAHEDLPDGGRDVLPDSDLLKTVHSYTSHFYRDLAVKKDTTNAAGKGASERFMDETALLAFGILLEEAGREVLGEGGDLVFTEGVMMGEDDEDELFGFKDAPEYEARGSNPKPI
ncbi:hypothetical protein F4777DRAFT_142574 [Nemania sp. FL0916]|nr:hypothetical protein F4777DRAFT_142574 [Nemania sp. FL0916]